ncbi:MAG: hypothetical protein AMXMBFR26_07310 [Porticoccaceae bacterium]
MEALLLIIGLGIAGFVAHNYFKTSAQNPETLTQEDTERTWVELKQRILQVSPYEDKHKYRRLYYRLRDLLGSIINRHRHFLDDVQARRDLFREVGSCLTEIEVPVGELPEYRVTSNLPLDSFSSELILFLCLVSYNGAVLSQYGRISSNKWFLNRGVEYLIAERDYAPAIFLKGLVFKYGLDVFYKPRLPEARELLARASAAGIGGALFELNRLDQHERLTNIDSVHIVHEEWFEGEVLSRLEKARSNWIR